MRLSPRRVDDQPIRVIAQPVKLSVWAVAGGWLARKFWRALVIIVTTPAALATLTLIAATVAVWHRFGPWPIIIALVLVLGTLIFGRSGGRPPSSGSFVILSVHGVSRGGCTGSAGCWRWRPPASP